MRVVGVGHVSVNCHGRLEECRVFYAEVLGLVPIDRPDIVGVPGHWFDAGGVQVHLVGSAPLAGGPAAADRERRIDPGATHHCLLVADLDLARRQLSAAGIDMLEGGQRHPHGVVAQLWCCDPAGNVVELQQAR